LEKLIIISNRLPYNINFDGVIEGRNIGGLATGIKSYLDLLEDDKTVFTSYKWVGWCGITNGKDSAPKKFKEGENILPVFLSKALVKGFYTRYCNQLLWPYFHDLPQYSTNTFEDWTTYLEVNLLFFEKVKPLLKKGTTIWIHDYHFMLLPRMIKQYCKEIKIVFFLHIPFPTNNVFKEIPKVQRHEILNGLDGANVIGFHTESYVKNFKKVLQEEDIENLSDTISSKLKIFPMGLDFDKYQSINNTIKTPKSESLKTIISIDRLDYTKGILQKIDAYIFFIRHYPYWKQRIQLVLNVAPSRINISQYHKLKMAIERKVLSMNETYGLPEWQPIIYSFIKLDEQQMIQLYRKGDVCLVTPIVDGLNLIAKEFLASNSKGVLILSDNAGVASELKEAIQVNPLDIQQVSKCLLKALLLSPKEICEMNKKLRTSIKENDIRNWAEKQFASLREQDFILGNTKIDKN
jgi:trehalose 6-phosphate synthase/phosphatase